MTEDKGYVRSMTAKGEVKRGKRAATDTRWEGGECEQPSRWETGQLVFCSALLFQCTFFAFRLCIS